MRMRISKGAKARAAKEALREDLRRSRYPVAYTTPAPVRKPMLPGHGVVLFDRETGEMTGEDPERVAYLRRVFTCKDLVDVLDSGAPPGSQQLTRDNDIILVPGPSERMAQLFPHMDGSSLRGGVIMFDNGVVVDHGKQTEGTPADLSAGMKAFDTAYPPSKEKT